MARPDVDVLTDALVRDLTPVRRLRSPASRTGAWLALEALVLGCVLAVDARPDAGALLAMPGFLLEFVAVVAAAAALALLAFRSAVPGAGPGGLVRTLAGVALVVAAVHVLTLPLRVDGSLGAFLAGRTCAARMARLTVVPWLVMLVLLRRAAPFRGATAGALAAGAACLMAFAFMRLACPSDEVLHVVAWHALPIVGVLAASAVVGAFWLPRWRR